MSDHMEKLDRLERLDRFVRARNARRSHEREAEGFISGKRVYSLGEARKEEARALLDLADWAEDKARAELGWERTPR